MVLNWSRLLLLDLFVVCGVWCAVASARPRAGPRLSLHRDSISQDLIGQCDVKWFKTNLDHFSRAKGPGGEESFDLRYYECNNNYRKTPDGETGPIFFYLGNESDVLLYLNATGLMWENAERFGASLIFAEHRYYGESLPFGKNTSQHMEWLTSEQALADYATLLNWYKKEHQLEDSPVIGFGGSYGGMLAAWGRLKYPHIWAGAIAGSAPIWTFAGETPSMNPNFFAEGVTFDTTQGAGSEPGCTSAIRHSWDALIDVAVNHEGGIKKISEAMHICPNVRLNTTDDVKAVRDWAAGAFDTMAMGNFPYPSSYLLNGNGMLPAFPVRAACTKMMDIVGRWPWMDPSSKPLLRGPSTEDSQQVQRPELMTTPFSKVSQIKFVQGLSAASSVFYNYTGEVECYDPWAGVNEESAHDGDYWDWQYCTEMFMPFGKNGLTDMFWDEPWDEAAARAECKKKWGVEPRSLWATAEYGGKDLESLSNVVFSNGLLDPWHGGGVLTSQSPTVKAVIIAEGAHHLDLMFSNPEDPVSVSLARVVELQHITEWIAEFRSHRSRLRPEERLPVAN